MLSIRKIGVIGRTYRHLNRYRQILSILFKFGFGDLVDLLNIDQYIEIGIQMISRKPRDKEERLTRAERMRFAVEELGPTYIKLGQILSTRPDLLPADVIQELSKLQDAVAPHPFEALKDIIEVELKAPLENFFSFVSDTPIASASIGQVHRGRLKNGEDVAIKIQRPDIQKTIEVDLEIMLHLATLMERHIEEIAFHRPVKVVEEFARTLEKELDYTLEAANMARFRKNFQDDPTILVPRVYFEISTGRILTMAFIEGIKVSRLDRLDAAGMDRRLIVIHGAALILKQVLIHGFFHADPHPGNFFILPDHVICLLDFGMVGVVDRDTREEFVELIDSIAQKNEERVVRSLLKLTEWEREPEMRLLERDMADFMAQHFFKPLKEIELGKFMQQMLGVATRHRLQIPPNLFLMIKALSTLDGVARQLDPEFDVVASAAPFVIQVRLERFSPRRLFSEFTHQAADLLRVTEQLPREFMEVIRMIRQQHLLIKVEHQGLEEMLATHDQISNRISFSIIIAALVVGSALIVISKTPPFIFGISLIGIIGFLAAAIMGIWLLIAILKKGKL
ncbi:MAG: AarF/ABC1/UbiB kinase family protein [Pseudomonadota bacterium]